VVGGRPYKKCGWKGMVKPQIIEPVKKVCGKEPFRNKSEEFTQGIAISRATRGEGARSGGGKEKKNTSSKRKRAQVEGEGKHS